MSGMDYLFNCIKKKISKDDFITFVIAFVAGMLCHGYAYLGNYPTYGGLNMFIKKGSAFAKETRWLSAIIVVLDGKVTMPLFLGILATTFWALSVVFIIKMLGQKSRFSKILTSCCFMTFPVIASMNCFMYMAHLFAIACFLSVLGAYYWYKNAEEFKIKNAIISVLCMVGCLSMYQPTLSMALVLIFICVGFEFAVNDSLKRVWKRVFEALIYVVVAMLLWIVNDAVAHTLLHIESAASMLSISAESIIKGIAQCYTGAFNFLFMTSFFSRFAGRAGLVITFALILFMVIIRLGTVKDKKNFAVRVLLIAALFVMYPMAAGYTFIALPDTSVVNRLFLSHILLIPFAITLADGITDSRGEEEKPSLLVTGICLLMSCTAVCMTVFFTEIDNTAYMSAAISYEKEYSLALRIVDRIEADPEYVEGMPVMILVGADYVYKNNINESPMDILIPGMEQSGNVIMHNLTGITNFVNNFIQTDINIEWHMLDEEKADEIGIWPATDCTKVIDGVMYLRLS